MQRAILVVCLCVCSSFAVSPARAQRIAADLRAYYRFEEGTGAMVYDLSGAVSPLDLTISAQPETTYWLPSGGLLLSNATSVASILAAEEVLQASIVENAFTVELWLRPSNKTQGAPEGGNRSVVLSLSDSEISRNFTLQQAGELFVGHLRTTATLAEGEPVTLSGVETSLTHLAVTFDAGVLRAYRDGEEAMQQDVGGDLSQWRVNSRLLMGNDEGSGASWLGELHLAAVYSRALSHTELLQNFADGPHGASNMPPSVIAQPVDVTVNEPGEASFSVTAAGSPVLTYQWRRDGAPIDGATAYAYTVPPPVTVDDAGGYDVIVSNQYGVVTSVVASLTVHPYVPTPAQITHDPQAVTVTEGQSAEFTVVAVGDAPLHYQWRRDGSLIEAATSTVYRIQETTLDDSGAGFDVVVSNAFGVATSAVATLTVDVYVPPPPTLTQHPANLTVTEPDAAGFAVVAEGPGPLTYQWRRNGAVIGGATGETYVLSPTSAALDDGAVFDVVVSNPNGETNSLPATLTVETIPPPPPPEITHHPASVSVTEPDAAGFVVVADGPGPLTYQWRRNGVVIGGATGEAYVLSPTSAALDDGAVFDVVVSNPNGETNSLSATLTVQAPPPPLPPEITHHPASLTVEAPAPAGFVVVASGKPPLAYQWLRDGEPIWGQTGEAYVIDPTRFPEDDGAGFSVLVSDGNGSVTSRVGVLTVTGPPLPEPPVITVEPEDRTVMEPTGTVFQVTAVGREPLTYQWYRDGVALPGAATAFYTLGVTDASGDDAVGFHVVVANVDGTVTSRTAVLTVLASPGPPTIHEQPQGDAVIPPWSSTFTVTAEGPEPLHYQWRRDGVPIAGADGMAYTLDPTAEADHGAGFDVVVSNHHGSVTSQVAVLTIQSRRPMLTWLPVPGATWYRLLILDANGTYLDTWLNQTNGSWTAESDFKGGAYRGWIRPWGPDIGYAPWMGPYAIEVPTMVPEAAIPLAPTGAVAEPRPVFAWTQARYAVWYNLLVQRDGVAFIKKWVKQAYTYTPDEPLRPGDYIWWVRTWGVDGLGPWSRAEAFDHGIPHLLEPAGGTGAERRPVFVWTERPELAWYQLSIERNGEPFDSRWLKGVAEWQPVADLPYGDYTWRVRGWNAAGMGSWAPSMDFTVGAAVPISGSGGVLRWDAAGCAEASWYRLWLTRNDNVNIELWVAAADTTVDGAHRLFTPSPALSAGTYEWWVHAWLPSGAGPWSDALSFSLP